MGNLELVEASLPDSDFSFYITKLPEGGIEDKLALASPESGVICRMEYQNFLYMELVLNLERLFHYMAETSGGDPDVQMKIREHIESEVYRVNPLLSPDKVVMTKGGVLRMSSKAEGIQLDKVSGWDREILDINPYIVVEEIEIIDAPEIDTPTIDMDPTYMGRFETVECKWDRLNVDLKIRKFSKSDLSFIFGSDVSFSQDLHYKIHIIQRCLESANAVFALCDAVGLSDEARIPTLADELYELCVKINPFLRIEDVDLEGLRVKKPKRSGNTTKRGKQKTQTKKGSGKVFADVTKKELLTLSDRIKARVIGQHEAVDKIVDTIQIASCGLRNPEKPIATYMMCGTTGVGKTLISKVLAEELCGSRENMVRIDCSEYTQQHDVQKLIGAPPSYVGYEDGGFLTNAIQENPFSIVLFDEIEKAHSKLFDMLLQIMDDARLTDGKGNVTDFRNCIILMTSNIGVSEAEAVKSTTGFGEGSLLTEDKREKALKTALKNRFRPEFLNRIDETLSFRSLNREDALQVVGLLLDKVQEYLVKKDITVEFTDKVKNMVFDKGFSKKYGARPLERTIDREIIKAMAKMLLRDEIKESTRVRVDFVKDKLKVTELKKPKLKRKKISTVVKA
jgi:DNA polymerase III delta prime subunit